MFSLMPKKEKKKLNFIIRNFCVVKVGMNSELLPDVLFQILAKTSDVRTCISVWCSSKQLYQHYPPEVFWEHMCFYFFRLTRKKILNTWLEEFWSQYKKVHGCIFCKRPLARNSDVVVSVHNTNFHVCSRCKQFMGDKMIHYSMIDEWQTMLINKIRSTRMHTCLLKNYYGEKQIHSVTKYRLRCVECISNPRNMLCEKSMCGACCQCRFHKSFKRLTDDKYHFYKYNLKKYHVLYSSSI